PCDGRVLQTGSARTHTGIPSVHCDEPPRNSCWPTPAMTSQRAVREETSACAVLRISAGRRGRACRGRAGGATERHRPAVSYAFEVIRKARKGRHCRCTDRCTAAPDPLRTAPGYDRPWEGWEQERAQPDGADRREAA